MSPAPFRYRRLGYAALNVSDLERSRAFYADVVGLDEVTTIDKTSFLRCSSHHHDIILYENETPGIKRIGWELECEDDLAKAFDHFARADLNPTWISDEEANFLRQGPSFRLREPNTSLCLEYFTQIMRLTKPFVSKNARIERVGHVVLSVKSLDKFLETATGPLNFLISDYGKGMIAFLRCFPNPLHHSFAIQQANANRLNHVNFMVRDIDDVGRALNRFRSSEVPIVFGPGRHLPSGSIFLYFLDPDGMTLEYSFGMEEFPEQAPRKARMLEPTFETIDLWGGRPTSGFGAVGEIEGP